MDDLTLIMKELEKLKKESIDIISQVDNSSSVNLSKADLNQNVQQRIKETKTQSFNNQTIQDNDYSGPEDEIKRINKNIEELKEYISKIESSKLQFEKMLLKSIKFLIENSNNKSLEEKIDFLIEEIDKLSSTNLRLAKLIEVFIEKEENKIKNYEENFKKFKNLIENLIEVNKKIIKINNSDLEKRVEKLEKITNLITEDLEKLKS